jgi:hypothetical protein
MTSLKNVLLINSLSSGVTGAGLLVFANAVAGLFGVSQPHVFWGVGAFLIAFAGLVFSESRRLHPRQSYVRLIIVLDTLWVVGSLIIVVLHLFDLSTIGYVAITAVAVWVGLMAYLQRMGLRKLIHSPS